MEDHGSVPRTQQEQGNKTVGVPIELLRRCWIVAGPTAAGKSDVGLILAEQLGGEILALDSMTIYRGLDIGTAKPTQADRARIPHHLIDLVDPWEEFSVSDYLKACQSACEDILSRGKLPILVGGTGLYLRSILRGICESPQGDWEIRRRWESFAQIEGPERLHAELTRIDPTAAAAIHPNNVRRVIRALEVFELTGVPISELQLETIRPPEERPERVVWLHPPRDWLYDRINQRVLAMFASGLLREVQQLCSGPRGTGTFGRTARQALGYKEVLDHLAGKQSLEETNEQIQTRTRQFAKRQHTWFRGLEECSELILNGTESPDQIARLIIEGTSSR